MVIRYRQFSGISANGGTTSSSPNHVFPTQECGLVAVCPSWLSTPVTCRLRHGKLEEDPYGSPFAPRSLPSFTSTDTRSLCGVLSESLDTPTTTLIPSRTNSTARLPTRRSAILHRRTTCCQSCYKRSLLLSVSLSSLVPTGIRERGHMKLSPLEFAAVPASFLRRFQLTHEPQVFARRKISLRFVSESATVYDWSHGVRGCRTPTEDAVYVSIRGPVSNSLSISCVSVG